MADADEVRFRLVRSDDTPATNPLGDDFVFGLQDTTKNQIVVAERLPDGRLCWDFTLRVKPGPDPDHPVFLGRFASGPAHDRFVYLSWLSVPRQVWINRLKCRLGAINWQLVRAARASDKPITADMSGRTPGQSMKPVGWRVEQSGLSRQRLHPPV